MKNWEYEPVFDYGADQTDYRRLDAEAVTPRGFAGGELLAVEPAGLELLAREAFGELAFFLRRTHLEQLAAILSAADASVNDRFVAAALLKNAVISAEGVLPLCQDTGTASVFAFKGGRVFTPGDDAAALARGIRAAWQKLYLRASQLAPLSLFEEVDTGDNLPAQIELNCVSGEEYRFLFIAKGAGSANKTALFPASKALLQDRALFAFLREQIAKIGVAACPPYHLAVAIGGLSPEMTLKTVKLASAGYLDGLPRSGNARGRAFRDAEYESRLLGLTREPGPGAQFGGRYFAHDVRVVRLPRHAGSCFVGIGLSCSADRNLKGKITREGIFLERLDRDPARFLSLLAQVETPETVRIDLNAGMDAVRRQLSACRPGTLTLLNGTLIVARDIAHARLAERLAAGQPLPDYFKSHPVFYAGPARTPPGFASGSLGPTTAQRMDGYLDAFMAAGASLVTLAKGNRAPGVTAACKKYGGFYLGAVGGAAALAAREYVAASEIVDFADLDMEAVRRVTVTGLPAFVICDDKGGSLY